MPSGLIVLTGQSGGPVVSLVVRIILTGGKPLVTTRGTDQPVLDEQYRERYGAVGVPGRYGEGLRSPRRSCSVTAAIADSGRGLDRSLPLAVLISAVLIRRYGTSSTATGMERSAVATGLEPQDDRPVGHAASLPPSLIAPMALDRSLPLAVLISAVLISPVLISRYCLRCTEPFFSFYHGYGAAHS